MGLALPYTYISCPCSDKPEDTQELDSRLPTSSRSSQSPVIALGHGQAPFDSRHPRSSFSLFPLEHLLYCEECQDLKCSRCVTEEHISYFCTSCLFETSATAVASEGYRCSRNCFNCPICFSQLSVSSIDGSIKDVSWVLNCNYCMWTSLDIGIKFERPTNIRAQLDRIANGGKLRPPSKNLDSSGSSRGPSHIGVETSYPGTPRADSGQLPESEQPNAAPPDPISSFAALKSFYRTQLTNESNATDSSHSASREISYSSPASLARILSMYSTSGAFPSSKRKGKPALMREALSSTEGLRVLDPAESRKTIPSLVSDIFNNTVSLEQRSFQSGPCGGNPYARFVEDLRPMPTQLAAKNAKRCKDCKHILVKPDPKPTSTRYRIKLLALSYIPTVILRQLHQVNTASGITSKAAPSDSSMSRPAGGASLEPGKTSQWVMTLRNPQFDVVRVSLATPAVTPGKWGHRVTILCPQFSVGTNRDVWDEALNSKDRTKDNNTARDGKEHARDGGPVAEAGKVYDHGRNWTSVALEVVPAEVRPRSSQEEHADDDDDILEIPIRVRLEWKQGELDDSTPSRKARLNEDRADDGKRELGYWMVLGIGRVKMAGR